MNLTKFKRMIGQCDDVDALHKLKAAATNRIDLLSHRKAESARAQAWANVSGSERGSKLYSHRDFGGLTMRRFEIVGRQYLRKGNVSVDAWGKEIIVRWLRPRKKELFVEIGGQIFELDEQSIEQLDLRPEPCPAALGDVLTGGEA